MGRKKILKKNHFLQGKVVMSALFLIFLPLCRGEIDNSKYISIRAWLCQFGIERWKIILLAITFIDNVQLNPWSIHQHKWMIEEEEANQQMANWGWWKNEVSRSTAKKRLELCREGVTSSKDALLECKGGWFKPQWVIFFLIFLWIWSKCENTEFNFTLNPF